MPEIAELIEQFPELRLRPLDTRDIHAHNRMQRTDEAGAYEWWEINALDDAGCGLTCSLHLGHAFDPAYRRNVRQIRAGRFVDASLGRKSATAALRLAVFLHGRLAARSEIALDVRSCGESPPGRPWSITLGRSSLSAEGEGWRLTIDAPCTTTSWRHVLRPAATGVSRVTADLLIRPRFHTTTFWRRFLPDSPIGATHDWLPACPSASVNGTIEWTGRGGRRALPLDAARGSLDHFRGSGPIGEGLRRFFLSRAFWPAGAAIGELVIIRKYIQLAPILMVFADGEVPRIARGDRTPRAEFQRSAWLLGYPLALTWASETRGMNVSHSLNRLADASPCRTIAVSRCSIAVESASRDVRLEDQAGLVQMIQPPRLDSWPWKRWCAPISAS